MGGVGRHGSLPLHRLEWGEWEGTEAFLYSGWEGIAWAGTGSTPIQGGMEIRGQASQARLGMGGATTRVAPTCACTKLDSEEVL